MSYATRPNTHNLLAVFRLAALAERRWMAVKEARDVMEAIQLAAEAGEYLSALHTALDNIAVSKTGDIGKIREYASTSGYGFLMKAVLFAEHGWRAAAKVFAQDWERETVEIIGNGHLAPPEEPLEAVVAYALVDLEILEDGIEELKTASRAISQRVHNGLNAASENGSPVPPSFRFSSDRISLSVVFALDGNRQAAIRSWSSFIEDRFGIS